MIVGGLAAGLVVAIAFVVFVNFGLGPLHEKLRSKWRKYYNQCFDMAKFKVMAIRALLLR